MFNFKENAFFSSLTVKSFPGWVILYASKYLSKVTEDELTFSARVGPISVKYLLKFSARDFISLVSFISTTFFFYFGNDYWQLFPFPIASLIADHVLFHVLFAFNM